jgi:aspartyl-tRNA(Asn)/glutamyl-tRNA(Gln) amidotransferase subunit C
MVLRIPEVEHIAELAKLALTEDEKRLYAEQLSDILDYAARLQAVDTSAIPPTASVLGVSNVMRSDEVQPSLSRAEVLANAPDAIDGHFRVRAVLESEG